MNRIVSIAALAGMSWFLAGCKKDIKNEEAVKAAIQKRLVKTGFTPDNMSVNVTRVTFHDNDAQATVSFVPKGSPANSGVTFKYNLQREKDEWIVTGPAAGDATSGHTGMGRAGSDPGIDPGSQINPPGTLPSGHPSVGAKP